MGFKNFRFQVILRVLLLVASVFLFFEVDFKSSLVATQVAVGMLIVVQTVALILFIEGTTERLIKFLNTIKYDDFSEVFSSRGEGKVFDELYQRYNEVIRKFRDIRSEKEATTQYYQTVVQHIGIGIITFKKSGEIQLINNAAKRLLQVGQLSHVEHLKNEAPQLVEQLLALPAGQSKVLQLKHGKERVPVSLFVVDLVMRGEDFRLASIQNIQRELEEKEMEAWQNLIRVLTHEIMNSVTPISSLAGSVAADIQDVLEAQTNGQILLQREETEDMGMALQTIERRSQGLVRFVQDFRSLARVPVPKKQFFSVPDMLRQLQTLFQEELMHENILLLVNCPSGGLQVLADRELVEQVLINLIRNAIHALAEQPTKTLQIEAFPDQDSRVVIQVTDNGSGIAEEAQEQIFLPFYTTKATGTGIGLSLSRQIMRLHKGSLTVSSELGQGTTFTMRF
ncbi:sensor histidine kinase [Rufibacter latericius]|uniref:histidine kinase n=1 Tax=Rufibacter latericius TaxID=2487040 RepID=A0A3M9MMU6_9BACT|nr:ATP-binding protein [Rufibacter latericius]RNI26866.1 GHKL domain-containing protein [Rufibacter latericius]